MYKKFLSYLIAVIAICMMASCGSGSGSSGKQLASHEIFGDLLNLLYQKSYTDSIFYEEKEAVREKWNNSSSSSAQEKWDKAKEKFDAREDEEKAKFKAEVEKIKPALVGKDIPFEVEDGTGYEITSCKIHDIESNYVYIEFEVKITDVKAAKFDYQGMFDKSNPKLSISTYEVDKNGNRMGSEWNNVLSVEVPEKADGATGKATGSTFYIAIENPERYMNFAKIKFVKE